MEDTAADPLLSPGEALSLLRTRGLRINGSTLRRYAQTGRIPSESLPSGHRRYRLADIERIATGHQPDDPEQATP